MSDGSGEEVQEYSTVDKFDIPEDARYRFAMRFLPDKKDAKVLVLPCNGGYGASMLAGKGVEVHAVDPEKESIAHAIEHFGTSKASFHQFSLEELVGSFKEGYFDLIVSFQPSLRYVREGDVGRYLRRPLEKVKRLVNAEGGYLVGLRKASPCCVTVEQYVNRATTFLNALFPSTEFWAQQYSAFLPLEKRQVLGMGYAPPPKSEEKFMLLAYCTLKRPTIPAGNAP